MTSNIPPVQGPAGKPRGRGLLIALLIVGIVILSLIAFIATLLHRRSYGAVPPPTATGSALATASASATPTTSATVSLSPPATSSATIRTKTVTATATTTVTTATGPQVQTFAVVPQSAISGTTVTCTRAENLFVDFSWATNGATAVDFGVATYDASQAPYLTDLPATGSLGSDRAVAFQCYADSGEHTQFYTLTVLSLGQKVSRTITLKESYVP